jgi:hypothetical protein
VGVLEAGPVIGAAHTADGEAGLTATPPVSAGKADGIRCGFLDLRLVAGGEQVAEAAAEAIPGAAVGDKPGPPVAVDRIQDPGQLPFGWMVTVETELRIRHAEASQRGGGLSALRGNPLFPVESHACNLGGTTDRSSPETGPASRGCVRFARRDMSARSTHVSMRRAQHPLLRLPLPTRSGLA